MIWFFLGCMLGGLFGVLVMCLMHMAAESKH